MIGYEDFDLFDNYLNSSDDDDNKENEQDKEIIFDNNVNIYKLEINKKLIGNVLRLNTEKRKLLTLNDENDLDLDLIISISEDEKEKPKSFKAIPEKFVVENENLTKESPDAHLLFNTQNSIQLTGPTNSQLIELSLSKSKNYNSSTRKLLRKKIVKPNLHFVEESKINDEICKLCKIYKAADEDEDEDEFSGLFDSDRWIMCFGCGEGFHRKCLEEGKLLQRIKCEIPLIFRQQISKPTQGTRGTFSHAPWYCNDCVNCSVCKLLTDKENDHDHQIKSNNLVASKDLFVACRHCGIITCQACYNSENFLTSICEMKNISRETAQLTQFERLQNYSCPKCLKCVNCGIKSGSVIDGEDERYRSIILYSDSTLCRPCYLSKQICATCPRCKQIYHSLPSYYDFGEVPYDSDFSLCPMVSCDACGSWTHCQCEGIDEDEYERLGTDEDSQFICINCKPFIKFKDVPAFKTFTNPDLNILRRGNLMILADKIIFRYWCFNEPWKRKVYELAFSVEKNNNDRNKCRFILNLDYSDHFDSCEILRAKSLQELAVEFKKRFQLFDKKVTNYGLNCQQAIRPECLLNPATLLNFLDSTGRFAEVCRSLRLDLGEIEEHVCARTRPFERVVNIKQKALKSDSKRLSLIGLQCKTPANNTSSSGNMLSTSVQSIKYSYFQYLQAIRADSTIHSIDASSQGLALRSSVISGYGLFATRPFFKNSLIIEYCGEFITNERVVDRRDLLYNSLGKWYKQSCYLFRLDESKVLDATFKGNLSRFINHSCEPNCYSRVIPIEQQKKLLIFASKNIASGEEILYDYKFPDEEQKIPCFCGSEKCRKWMN